MKILIEYDKSVFPHRLILYIFDAPHRRQDEHVLRMYRESLVKAAKEANIKIPIEVPIDLNVTFINPTSPDLDNLITALYRVIDGKALSGLSVLEDDGLIQYVEMRKFYPNAPSKSEIRIP